MCQEKCVVDERLPRQTLHLNGLVEAFCLMARSMTQRYQRVLYPTSSPQHTSLANLQTARTAPFNSTFLPN